MSPMTSIPVFDISVAIGSHLRMFQVPSLFPSVTALIPGFPI
jgi:hypothetical protein